MELGRIIKGNISLRTSSEQIAIAGLAGVAVQDIQIAKAISEASI